MEEFEFEIPCNSLWCKEEGRTETHPADWLVLKNCSHTLFWCQVRFHHHATIMKWKPYVWCHECGWARKSLIVAWSRLRG